MAQTSFQVIILGSGTSTGVPIIGCHCDVCVSDEPKNKRTRTSIAIAPSVHEHLVIDTGPEFRLQVLSAGIKRVGHVFYTHTHADHCHGFDDLRAFYFHSANAITCHISREHALELQQRFSYAFTETGYVGTKPVVDFHFLDDKPFEVLGLPVEAAKAPHGAVQTTVFKFGRFAYATDFKRFEEPLIKQWQGKIDVMVASGLRFKAHPTHSTIEETLELFDRLQVKRGILTHLSHDIDFDRDALKLPPGREFAYDGMVIDVVGG